MDGRTEIRFDPMRVPTTPAFVVDEALLRANLEILDRVRRQSGAKVLLALKAFAMPRVFGLLRQTLDGVCASSPHEARLGREEFGREVHTFAAGYSEAHVRELALTTDHLVFNSPAQLERFGQLALDEAQHAGRELELALRINPEYSEGTVPLYDPCDPGSRLGIRRADFKPELLEHITGLHFHTLCEQNADSLERTLDAVERRFNEFLGRMRYVNFGGGHHITRPDYDVDLLIRLIRDFRAKYDVEVYLEPGEAVALNTGYLVTEVLDIVPAGKRPVAILDTAVPCHMPDVIEMPYRPHVVNSGEAGAKAYTYGLGGLSCLAGDMAGDYSFDTPLAVGDRLVFTDMAHYTMVKTNTFNGVALPAIHLLGADINDFDLIRQFGYGDFTSRL